MSSKEIRSTLRTSVASATGGNIEQYNEVFTNELNNFVSNFLDLKEGSLAADYVLDGNEIQITIRMRASHLYKLGNILK